MEKIIKGIKHFFIYIFIRIILGIINLLPLSLAYFFASTMANLSYYILMKDRRTALANLKKVYGTITDSEAKKIYIKSLKNIGYCAVDVLRFKKFGRQGIIDMVECEGLEHFDAAYERGKGIIGITGHISNFELTAAWFGVNGYKAAAVVRKIYDNRLNRLLIENRQAINVRCLDSEAPVKYVLRTLKEGYAIGALIDQDSTRYRGEFINFFGTPAYTPIGSITLARAAKAAIIPLVVLRIAPKKYQIKIFPEIEFDYKEERKTDTIRILKESTKILENVIRDNPEQWVWMHKRWKTQPGDVKDT